MHELQINAPKINRLRAYAKALGSGCDNALLQCLLNTSGSLEDIFESFRKRLSAGTDGDFLAFRLVSRFSAIESDFRQPPLERRPLAPAVHTLKTSNSTK